MLEDNILCILFYHPHFQTIKKVYLILENLDQLRNQRLRFTHLVNTLVRYLLQLTDLLKPDFNCCSSFLHDRN